MSDNFPVAFIVLAILSAAIAGTVIATSNFILIGLVVGLFVGAFLWHKLIWSIWLVLFLGLLVTGLVPLWYPTLEHLNWAASLLGLLLLTKVVIHFMTTMKKSRTPAFFWIAFVFLLYSLIISMLQWYSASEFAGAVKRYFQVWGLLFALVWLTIPPADIKRFQNFMLLTALIQLPFAAYELAVMVPLRRSLAASNPGLNAIDIVSGTFGGTLLGGGANAEMATFLMIVFAFLLSRYREGLISGKRIFFVSIPVLLPLFMGETKIVVIFFPILLFGLYGRQLLKNPAKAMLPLLIGVMLTALMGYVYATVYIGLPIQTVIDNALKYNLYNEGYGGNLLNRTSVLSFWWQKNSVDPIHLLFGHGLGSAHAGGGLVIPGHIDLHYSGYGIGLTAASELLWETGAIGFCLFLAIIFLAWQHAGVLLSAVKDRYARADIAVIRAVLPIFGAYLFYRNAMLETMSFQIVFMCLLGYLAVLSRWTIPAMPHVISNPVTSSGMNSSTAAP
jgi:hypothetical protein